ncbi:MAG: hypothetical protein MRZ75_02920 [Roseburia sp.]|uniref:hypothetical protein n=1 Tax=Roseburia sp. 831b TaxID=1261635 RepID=UPI00095289D2|nr:hypothetical protein [Roseburia sp. 831b]MCI5918269.1 hypothetical protein [Roseburia sp.]MDD6216799.1 hypothetical protein [Roseburia sp.]WVK72980.1 hypothetical protein BIV16_00165 [Roseburia sp. 831b]
MNWKKLIALIAIGCCFLTGCGMMEFPEVDTARVEKPINPERVLENKDGQEISSATSNDEEESESMNQGKSTETSSTEGKDSTVASSVNSEKSQEKLKFAIGNWDCLYGSWIDLNENQYTFEQDGTYTYLPYQASETETGTYTVETEGEKDYLVMLSDAGEKKKYELSMVRAGIGLYSTEEGKETELAAYLLSNSGE